MLPVCGFGFLLVLQALRFVSSGETLLRSGPSPTAFLVALQVLLLIAYYTLLVGLYLARLPARGRDRRPHIAIASFAGTFLVLVVPLLPSVPRRDWLLLPADALAIVGLAYALWSLAYLRRSFSILPQARGLVTGGPYALSRNPLYLGEILSSWAVFLPILGWAGAVALAVNVALQLYRIRAEERVLAAGFGRAYDDYRKRVPRLVPRPWRLLRPARAAQRPPGRPAATS